MDDDLIEADSSTPSADRVIQPIKGMESVIATVSGYHGTERFKLIKLIAITGASYVGVLDRSITHLVCWQFKGKKYDLARKLQTRIISHRWFEDCFKEGSRLPDGPYTMQSGKEVGPISCEVPHIHGGINMKRSFFSGEMNAEYDCYVSRNSSEGKMIDLEYLNWTDSYLLQENSFQGHGNSKKSLCTQDIRKSKRIVRKAHQSRKHQISNMDDPDNLPESSSRSSLRSKHRRDLYHDAFEFDESNRPAKIRKHMKYLNSPILEFEQANNTGLAHTSESSLDYANGNHTASPCVEIVPERLFIEGEENRKQSQKLTKCDDLCESEKTRECDAPVSLLHQQMELSCVICWTEFCSSRGVLPCGHRFCYSCIKEWADCMASKGKVSTCPLCKASFTGITRFEELSSSDQKIFSQTIPCSLSNVDIFLPPGNGNDTFSSSFVGSVCVVCRNREQEELLLSCHVCRSQWVHSCCLDPPLLPWTCIHCRDLRMLYQRFR